jgi:hypothetical protein
MTVQYDTRRDDLGWTVFDRWTGRVVVLQGADQVGLPWADADDLVERLNRRRLEGDREILQ